MLRRGSRAVAAAALAMSLWSGPSKADFAAGLAAYEAGDYATAFREWLPEAEAGNAAAQRNLGLLYQTGQGVEPDPARAVRWYRSAAEAGNARAQANVGNLYLAGEGVAQDYATAASWFELAARQGHTIAQFNLGLMYENGLGVEASVSRALEWYAMAADAGHPAALQQQRILMALSANRVPEPNPQPVEIAATPVPPEPAPEPVPVSKAGNVILAEPEPIVLAEPEPPQPTPALLIAEAANPQPAVEINLAALPPAPEVFGAEVLVPESQRPDLAMLAREADEAEAAAVADAADLKEPAIEPDPAAEVALQSPVPINVPSTLAGIEVGENPGIDGLIAYRRGDYLTALANLLPAAVQGDPSAQFLLGGMYRDGAGVPPDTAQAFLWWTLASAQGHLEATRFLANLRAEMDVDQLGQAVALLKVWIDRR